MRPCAKKGCAAEGTLYPVLCIRTVRGTMTLPLCEAHASETTVESLLMDEGFERLVASFRELGKQAPRRADIRVEFVNIASVLLPGEFNA